MTQPRSDTIDLPHHLLVNFKSYLVFMIQPPAVLHNHFANGAFRESEEI